MLVDMNSNMVPFTSMVTNAGQRAGCCYLKTVFDAVRQDAAFLNGLAIRSITNIGLHVQVAGLQSTVCFRRGEGEGRAGGRSVS
jgi:hypothetical protein